MLFSTNTWGVNSLWHIQQWLWIVEMLQYPCIVDSRIVTDLLWSTALLSAVEYTVDVELNVTDLATVEKLKVLLGNMTFLLSLGPQVNVTDVGITTGKVQSSFDKSFLKVSVLVALTVQRLFPLVQCAFHSWQGTSVGVRTSMAGHVTSVPPTDNVLTLQLTRAAASTPFLLTDSSVSQHFN